jgi:hypothetical protein
MEITKQKRILGQLEMDLSDIRILLKTTEDEERQNELRQAYRDLEHKIESQAQLIEDLESL